MALSMTGFGRYQLDTEHGQLTWEIKTVNHRYLDVSLRMPEEFRSLDQACRDAINRHIKRGKVEASLRFKPTHQEQSQLLINEHALQQVADACAKVQSAIPNASIQATDVLQWQGVIQEEQQDKAPLHKAALDCLAEASQQLRTARANEGERIKDMLLTRCNALDEQITIVRNAIPEVRQNLRDKVIKRIDDLGIDVDQGRIEQELVLQTQKMDVDEELDRLDAHLAEMRDILKRKEPIGRRLDFLVQECNREANTTASKSQASSVSQAAVEMKVLIEQLREQIQNVE